MAKFFSVSKNQGAVLSTMLVLILLAASYFYIYVPGNEKTVQERHFRCLQNIDYNIHAKIETSFDFIDNLLMSMSHQKISRDSLNNYISHYSKTNFTLLPIYPTMAGSDTANATADLTKFTLTVKREIDIPDKKVNSIGKETIKKGTANKSYYATGISYNIKQFIKPLLIAGVFDHYVVFYNNKDNDNDKNKGTNKVVFETFPSGLSYLKKDSLLQAKNGIVTPGIRSLNLSGTDYKVFTQAINIDARSEFIISGLVSDKNYQKEKDQLPSWFVLLLLTVAFGMIILLPWIKLYHMGNKDKLTVADGVSSFLVSMLLMSLLFFVIFKYSFSFHFNSNYKPLFYSSDSLATKITGSINKELGNAYNTLCTFDTVHQNFKKNIINFEKANARFDNENETSNDFIKYDTLKYDSITKKYRGILQKKNPSEISVKEVFWLDTSGKEKENWNTQSYNAPHIRYNTRDYFINIKENKFNKTGDPEFYLDQVVSKTRSVFTSVIAKKTLDPTELVAAMTFTVKSLDSVVMPDGYQFAVIDNKGEVRYHSLPQRNLNENLRYEFADSSMLVSCLEAKSDTTFKAEYYGKQYNIKIKPFHNLPYFIVIFEDLEYSDARDTGPYSFTLSMLICIMVFVAIQFGAVFFVSSKRSFFKKQMFDTSWIAPNKKSRRQYNLAIIANGIIIILLIIFYGFTSFLGYLDILLFSITLIAIFLTANFAIKYKKRGDPRYSFKIRAIWCLCLFVILIEYAACETLDPYNLGILILYEALSIALCTSVYNFGPYLLIKAAGYINNSTPGWNYVNSFALMVTTRLIVTSGIPVAFFFIYSFNYEQNLDTRYRQLNFAQALTKKIPFKNINDRRSDSILKDSLDCKGIYSDDVFIKNIELDSIYPKQPGKKKLNMLIYSKEDSNTVEMLGAFRLLINNIELRTNNLTSPTVDSEAFFSKITYRPIRDTFTTRTYYKIESNKNTRYIRLTSANINYPLSHLFFWLWLLLIIVIVIFYYITLNIIRKLFALNLPSQNGWEKMDEKLLLDNELNSLLLIVGSPGSGKLSKLKKMICEGKLYCNEKRPDCEKKGHNSIEKRPLVLEADDASKINVFIADMILIPAEAGENDPDWENHKKEALSGHALVIINHFEYNIKNPRANSIKLDFLESLMQKDASKIIIISTVHPLTFLDSYDEQQSNPLTNQSQNHQAINQEQNKQAANQPQNNCIPESELERWHVLLGHFRIIIEPLENSPHIHHNTDILKRNIFEETKYAHYLTKMQQMTMNAIPPIHNENLDMTSDSMIFKLQITSHYFYTYIWQSLTKEEKFLLYDLAEDGLVNSYDEYNLSMLISKGLVIKRAGILMLFNKGFRNFILTAIGNTEVNRIKDQVKDNGNWGNLKAPITLAILAILVFLITSQHEAYTRIITYVTALGAGVPAVLRLFSMVGNKNMQKTS